MQVESKKKKFTLLDYCSFTTSNTVVTNINRTTKVLNCICGKIDSRRYSCFKCKNEVHYCLECFKNRDDQFFQCSSCLNKSLDPIFQVKKVMLESYFRIENIFGVANEVRFQFELTIQDLRQAVQVRGIKGRKIALSWPMTGSFFINEQNEAFYQIKPLIINSNRKSRRQEYIPIPKQKLKRGKNTLIFKIYKLDMAKYTMKYQHEEKGLYYFSINLINKLQSSDLIEETFKHRRFETSQSLRLLNTKKNDIQITSEILTLICPYTKDRIQIPVRGKYCKHYSCVCLQTVIAYHMSNRLWTCPICDCRINEPYVDLFIYTILKDNNQDGEEVTVHKDGRYEWVNKFNRAFSIDQGEKQGQYFNQNQQRAIAEKMTLLDLQSEKDERKEKAQRKEKKLLISLIKDKIMNYGSQSMHNNRNRPVGMGIASSKVIERQQSRVIVEIKTLQCQQMNAQELKGCIKKTVQAKQHKLFIKHNNQFKNLFVELIK